MNNTLKILGYDYTVSVDGVVAHIAACGRLHSQSQILQIASDISEEQRISTVLHEIIEAINYHLELNLEHNIIMSLEAALYQVLKDNNIDFSPIGDLVKDAN